MIQSYTASPLENKAFAVNTTLEPYEAAWAKELVIVIRVLGLSSGTCTPSLQVSPNGIFWFTKPITLRDKDGIIVSLITGAPDATYTWYTDPITGFGEIFRLVLTVGGADPSFTVTIYYELKR